MRAQNLSVVMAADLLIAAQAFAQAKNSGPRRAAVPQWPCPAACHISPDLRPTLTASKSCRFRNNIGSQAPSPCRGRRPRIEQ
jgi:hypothetical protein